MKHLLLCSAVLLSACGPDVTPWKGTWTGSGSVNTGRQPQPFTGTLTIADGALFTGTTDAQGSPAVSFTASLTASTADGAAVTFKGPTTVQLTATPSDGCTRTVTIDEGSATRGGDIGDSLSATVKGKLKTDCMGGSSTAENFLLDLFANRR